MTWILIVYILSNGKSVAIAPLPYRTGTECLNAADKVKQYSDKWLEAICVPGPL